MQLVAFESTLMIRTKLPIRINAEDCKAKFELTAPGCQPISGTGHCFSVCCFFPYFELYFGTKKYSVGMQLKNFHHKYPVLFHLILMTLASGFILMGILFGLDIYTRHDSSIVMPELRGKDLKEAERLLSSHNLRYELVDSVYDKSLAPGVVVEMVPQSGNTVKPGRIIFLSINARSARKGIVPDLKDMSGRQALAILKGLGFEQVTERYISGDFVNLTDGVELADGRNVLAGTRLPITTPLVLRVINGYAPLPADSSLIDESITYGSSQDSASGKNEEENSESWW